MELLPEIIKIISDNLPAIITIGLTILSIVLGSKYKKFKAMFANAIELAAAINDAIEDDDITFLEAQGILNIIENLNNPD